MRYSPIGAFTFDLTDKQRRLCTWVADQARAGVRRIQYDDVKEAMHIDDDAHVTQILREMRERVDDVHKMIHSPIVNTADPYFDLHADADHIWDDYCRAEAELPCLDFDRRDTHHAEVLCHSGV